MVPTEKPLSKRTYVRSLAVALLLAGLLTAPASGATNGVAARTLTVHESIQARLVSHRGTTILNEKGRGSGTFSCPIVIDLKISYTQATITFTCATSGGSISGRGVTAYYAGGHTAHFSGTVSVTSGSRRYSHARGSVHINGTLIRGSYALSATVNGSISV